MIKHTQKPNTVIVSTARQSIDCQVAYVLCKGNIPKRTDMDFVLNQILTLNASPTPYKHELIRPPPPPRYIQTN